MQKIKFSFRREEKVKLISHLEIMRAFHRAIRRAKLPVALSQGFNPQLKMSFALPLPLGVTAEREMAEVVMEEGLEPEVFSRLLNNQLPSGLIVYNVTESITGSPNLMQMVDGARYHVSPIIDKNIFSKGFLQYGVEHIIKEKTITIKRKAKGKEKDFDIRPFIIRIDIIEKNGIEILEMFVQTGSRGGVKPAEILQVMGDFLQFPDLVYQMNIHRLGLYNKKENDFELIS